jgi:hypothetical protein
MEEAYANSAVNMTADVDVIDEGLYNNITYSGQNYIAANRDSMEFGMLAYSETLRVLTDCAAAWKAYVFDTYNENTYQGAGTAARSWLMVNGLAEATITANTEANDVSVGVKANDTFVPRSGHLVFKAAGVTNRVKVNQNGAGVRAAKGTIGYYANGTKKGQLTLEGDNGDGIDVVNAAYFKAGSLLALGGEMHTFDYRGFSRSKDVIAQPKEYTRQDDYLNIPYVRSSDIPWAWNPSKALGDPCEYYTSTFGGRHPWRMPTRKELSDLVAGATNIYTNSPEVLWLTKGGEKMLSAAGQRFSGTGKLQYQGTQGKYWSSEYHKGTQTELYSYSFDKDGKDGELGSGEVWYQNDPWTTIALPIRCVPNPGVRAPKGVIGYYASGPKRGQLTLDGDDGSNDGSGAVYVAYFKFGSLVPTKSQAGRGDAFNAEDVLDKPTDGPQPSFLTNLKQTIDHSEGVEAWEKVPDADDAAGVIYREYDNITAKLSGETYTAQGLGDPCQYYFDKDGSKGWRLPLAREHKADFGEGTTAFVDEVATPSADLPHWLLKDNGVVRLPAAGTRHNGGGGKNTFLEEQGKVGGYWSSTVKYAAANAVVGSSLQFWPSTIVWNGVDVQEGGKPHVNTFSEGLPVRCVQPQQDPNPGIPAVPGVIGYFPNPTDPSLKGKLTLLGDGAYGERVYTAYFKWGSLVAIGGQNRGDGRRDQGTNTHTPDFSTDDIIAVPDEFEKGTVENYRQSLQGLTYVQKWWEIPSAWKANSSNSGDGYYLINTPPQQNVTYELTDYLKVDNFKNGVGEACKHYFGDLGWRMPTLKENQDLVSTNSSISAHGAVSSSTAYYDVLPGDGTTYSFGFGSFPKGSAPGTYLPMLGYRSATNGAFRYSVENDGIKISTSGGYWASTAESSQFSGLSGVYALRFYKEGTEPGFFTPGGGGSGGSSPNEAMGIRCVCPSVTCAYR